MTRFSEPDVHQCPECSDYLLWSNMMSFSNYGHRTAWSDGCVAMGGILSGGSVKSCPACRALLWKEDLAVLGVLGRAPRPIHKVMRTLYKLFGDRHGRLRAENEWEAVPAEWKSAERGDYPTYPDLARRLLDYAGTGGDREKFLRMQIWHASNAHLRHRSDGSLVRDTPLMPEAERQANMLRMVEIYEAADARAPLRAELLRQLGRFDDAIALLRSGRLDIRDSATAAHTLRWAKAADADLKMTTTPTTTVF